MEPLNNEEHLKAIEEFAKKNGFIQKNGIISVNIPDGPNEFLGSYVNIDLTHIDQISFIHEITDQLYLHGKRKGREEIQTLFKNALGL